MKILIDMNLSPSWVDVLHEAGHKAVHWSTVGNAKDSDQTILLWARNHGYLVFTHDLDFGAILAATQTDSPSVIQIRTWDVSPENCKSLVLETIDEFSHVIGQGALISVDIKHRRVRILPICQ